MITLAVNQVVKRLVTEGAVGKVTFAKVVSSHGGPASGNWPMDPTWFYKKGAGPLPDMGVYGLHSITGILGPDLFGDMVVILDYGQNRVAILPPPH